MRAAELQNQEQLIYVEASGRRCGCCYAGGRSKPRPYDGKARNAENSKKGISNLKFQISDEEQLQEKRQSDTAENPERGRNFNRVR